MGSSDSGGYSGPIASAVGPPIPGLPVAGADSNIGDAYKYGKFQSFLPDLAASGPNPMATGLRPEMLEYKSPGGGVQQGGGGGGGDTIQALRTELAKVVAQQAQQPQQPQYGTTSVADQLGMYGGGGDGSPGGGGG
jgi:hypothetical protein